MHIHVVKRGDSLWKLSQQYGVSVSEIVKINGLVSPGRLLIGQAIVIPEYTRPTSTIDVNAFITQAGEEGAVTITNHAADLTTVSPFAYRVQADGTLGPIDDKMIDDTPLLVAAKTHQVAPMMAVTNFTSTDPGTKLAHTILTNQQLQTTLLDHIMSTMKNKGYQGLNVDLENVLPEDRENYNHFMQQAANRCHAEKFFISSSLAPKTSANQQGLLYEAHDYPAHGRIDDFVVLMTYEWGYRMGPPQAISPVNQIRKVLEYAVTAIPREKIMMGFQVYARDWTLPHAQGQEAETFDMQEAIFRALENNVTIQYDQTAQSPFYLYKDEEGRRHEVWFEDARSAQAKFDLVKAFGLLGVSYWTLEYPFPQNWVLLQENFNIRKF